METKRRKYRIIILTLLFCVLLSCQLHAQLNKKQRIETLKKYALERCISNSYRKNNPTFYSGNWLGVHLLQVDGILGVDSEYKFDKYIEIKTKGYDDPYPEHLKGDLNLICKGCLSFYRSKSLDNFVKDYLKAIRDSYNINMKLYKTEKKLEKIRDEQATISPRNKSRETQLMHLYQLLEKQKDQPKRDFDKKYHHTDHNNTNSNPLFIAQQTSKEKTEALKIYAMQRCLSNNYRKIDYTFYANDTIGIFLLQINDILNSNNADIFHKYVDTRTTGYHHPLPTSPETVLNDICGNCLEFYKSEALNLFVKDLIRVVYERNDLDLKLYNIEQKLLNSRESHTTKNPRQRIKKVN